MNAASCLLAMAFLTGLAQADEDLSLEQILARHQATLARLKRCTVTTHERWMMKSADGTPEKLVSTRKCDIRIDGERANLLVFEANYPSGVVLTETPSGGNANEFNYVCDGQALEIFYPHEEFSVRPARPSGVTGRLSPQKDDEFFIQNAIGNAGIVFGMAPFAGSITIAKRITLRKNDRIVRDETGYRVEGKAPDGTRHTIWFDPQSSFVIPRLKLEQTAETVGENRFQYNRTVMKSRYGFSEKAVVNSVVVELHNTKIVPWKDTHLITELEATKTITAADGAKAVERTTHTLTDWNLDPDFSDPASFAPRLPVPDGTRVQVQDALSLEYQYKAGKIELAVNQKTVDSLEHVQIPPRQSTPRMQWIWAIVASVLGFTWWRLRSGDS